jgi:glutamate transport system permease protein
VSTRATVLFDAPGPRTVRRHRLYSVLVVLALLVAIALVLLLFERKGQLEYDLWEPFITPVYVEALLQGLLDTLQMAAFSVVLSVVFGVIFGTGKLSDHAWVRWPAWAVVEFFRAVPVLLLMVFFFLAYGVGEGGIGSFWCVVIALTLYNGSVLAEVFRAGINAVPPGQAEAAYAIGMRKTQVMNIILLPQAVKIMLPSIISQCVVALKDTSLGYYILAPGLTAVGKAIYTEFQNQVQTAIVVTAMYVTVNLILTAIATWVQRKFVGEKRLDVPMVGQDGGGAGPAGLGAAAGGAPV